MNASVAKRSFRPNGECTLYACAQCGRSFGTGWSDEDAERELAATFPGANKAECEVVCEACYAKIMRENFG